MRWDQFIAELEGDYLQLDDNHVFKWSYGSIAYYEDKGWPHRRYDDREEDLVLVGGIMNHRLEDGMTCGGFVSFARPLNPSEHERNHALWTVSSLEPLTIEPSVLCKGVCHQRGHAEHGWIRNGVWVQA